MHWCFFVVTEAERKWHDARILVYGRRLLQGQAKVKTHDEAHVTFASWTKVQVWRELEAAPCSLDPASLQAGVDAVWRRMCCCLQRCLSAWRLRRRTRCSIESSRRVPIPGRDNRRNLGTYGAGARKERIRNKEKRKA